MKHRYIFVCALIVLTFSAITIRWEEPTVEAPTETATTTVPEVTEPALIEEVKAVEPPEPLILEPVKLAGRPELTRAAYLSIRAKGGSTTDPHEWILGLEWCESNGDNTAVNEIDRDGTASYYAFQFKPSTFYGYATKYGLIPKGIDDVTLMNLLADFELTRATVWNMMQDPTVVWTTQFPDCVKRHIGHPPEVPEGATLI